MPPLGDRAAESARPASSSGSWHSAPAATRDNCARSARSKEPQTPSFRLLARCSRASTALGRPCFTEGSVLPPTLAAIPRLFCLLSRIRRNQWGSRLPPPVLRLGPKVLFLPNPL